MQQKKDQYYLIGNPAKHSLSPIIHDYFAKQNKQSMSYDILELSLNSFQDAFITLKKTPTVKGLSITVPFKEKAFSLVDRKDSLALSSQSISNVVFLPDRTALGLNLDGLGLIRDLKKKQISLKDKSILIVGAGGAAHGILPSIANERPKVVTIANRTQSKANHLVTKFKDKLLINSSSLYEITDSYDLVINATSASIENNMLPVSSSNFNKNAIGYDLMYLKSGTVFTKWCNNNNILAYDGLGMLLELSSEVFKIWRGVTPSFRDFIV
jgi:shikimate dehydrogenase